MTREHASRLKTIGFVPADVVFQVGDTTKQHTVTLVHENWKLWPQICGCILRQNIV